MGAVEFHSLNQLHEALADPLGNAYRIGILALDIKILRGFKGTGGGKHPHHSRPGAGSSGLDGWFHTHERQGVLGA